MLSAKRDSDLLGQSSTSGSRAYLSPISRPGRRMTVLPYSIPISSSSSCPFICVYPKLDLESALPDETRIACLVSFEIVLRAVKKTHHTRPVLAGLPRQIPIQIQVDLFLLVQPTRRRPRCSQTADIDIAWTCELLRNGSEEIREVPVGMRRRGEGRGGGGGGRAGEGGDAEWLNRRGEEGA